MASLIALRDGIQARLETISGLRCYHNVPDKPELPAALVVAPPNVVTYDESMGGTARWLFDLVVLVSRWDAARAQDAIDPYIDTAGTQSVKAAIEGDGTLGGVADTTRVMRVARYGVATYAGIAYLAVEFAVEVISG